MQLVATAESQDEVTHIHVPKICVPVFSMNISWLWLKILDSLESQMGWSLSGIGQRPLVFGSLWICPTSVMVVSPTNPRWHTHAPDLINIMPEKKREKESSQF